jgi:anti-sigma regulatory factor (Ser/Thr protein kinase)
MRQPDHLAAATPGLVHEALFYEGIDDFVSQVTEYLDDELAAEHPVLVAVPRAHLGPVREAMGSAGRKVQWVDLSRDGRNPGAILPFVLDRFVQDNPGRRVGIVGEALWPERTVPETEAAIQYEALVNLALAGSSATMLCPYDQAGLAPEALLDAELTHPILRQAEGQVWSALYADPALMAASALEPLDEPPPYAVPFVVTESAGLRALREFIGQWSAAMGLDATRAEAMCMAVNELATNSLRHAGGPSLVHLWMDDQTAVCQVHDAGRVTDPLVGRRAPRAGQDNGYGLLIVNQLCDLVQTQFDPTGTTIRLTLTAPAPAAA